MRTALEQNYVRILKEEYLELKRLQRQFGYFYEYIEHLRDIEEARTEVKKRQVISQEQLFDELGI